MSLHLTPVVAGRDTPTYYAGDGNGMSLAATPQNHDQGPFVTPTLTGLQNRNRRGSLWQRFTREGVLDSASVSRSEAAELNNRAKWLEQRLADSEEQLREAVEEIVEMRRRERMLDDAISEAEEASRSERAKLQVAARDAQIKCNLLEKREAALTEQLHSVQLGSKQLEKDAEAARRELEAAKKSLREREAEAVRLTDERESLENKCDKLEDQLSKNLRDFQNDVRRLKRKEEELKAMEGMNKKIRAKIESHEEELEMRELKDGEFEAMEKRVAELESKSKRLEGENSQLRKQVAEKEAELARTTTVAAEQATKRKGSQPSETVKANLEAPEEEEEKEEDVAPGEGENATMDHTKEELMSMTVSELKKALDGAGVEYSSKGRKAQLQELALGLIPGGKKVEPSAPAPEEAAEDSQLPAVSDASSMKVAELRKELSRRGLDTSGVKAVLVARLTGVEAAEPKATTSVDKGRGKRKAGEKAPPKSPKRRATRRGKGYILDRLS